MRGTGIDTRVLQVHFFFLSIEACTFFYKLTMWKCDSCLCRNFLRLQVALGNVAVVAEWLRRWTRNPLGSARAGSNPADCTFCFLQTIVAIGLGAFPLSPHILKSNTKEI